MKQMRKWFALLLALALVLTLLPAGAMAAEPEEVPFSVSDGTVTDFEENGYIYTDYVYDPDSDKYVPVEKSVDLYTVTLPTDTASVTLDFGDDLRIAYLYDADGVYVVDLSANEEGYADNGQTGEASATVSSDDFSCFVRVQTPYDSDWNSETLYAVAFVPEEEEAFPFTVSADGAPVTDISLTENGYSYTEWDASEATSIPLYTVTLPAGTESATLDFGSDLRIAYLYDADGVYVGDLSANEDGYADNGQTGETSATVSSDDFSCFVRVQTPYDSDWNSETLYAVAFVPEEEEAFPFTVSADGAPVTDISLTENGYSYTEWDASEATSIPLYTVTLPAGTESATLDFGSDLRIAYLYDADGVYVGDLSANEDGYADNGQTGETSATVSSDDFSCFVRVQTPYDSDWNSDTLYAVAFEVPESDTPPSNEDITPDDLLHNLAAAYAESGVASDSQAPWAAADMAAYLATFPDTENKLSDEQKQEMADAAIAALEAAASPGDAAKYVIALVSMGFDPTQLTTAAGDALDGVAVLTGLTFTEEGSVADDGYFYYTLPYVLIAYQQFGDAYADQIDALVSAALACKSAWLDTSYGPDAATPMMLALAPYYETDADVADALDLAVAAVKGCMIENGGIKDSWGSGDTASAASTGLAVAAFAALGIDPATVTYGEDGKSLADGLLSCAVSESSFGGTFDNEQGFRGLIALANDVPYRIYDFSGQELTPVAAGAVNAGVTFKVIPDTAAVVLKNSDGETVAPVKAGSLSYDLGAGTYDYTVSAEGYTAKTGTVTVTEDQVTACQRQKINVSLVPTSSSGGSSSSGTITVKVRVLIHGMDTSECDGKWTYKHNAGKYYSIVDETVTLSSGVTARDALVAALDAAGEKYTEESNGYFSQIAGLSEFDHGNNSGWVYQLNGSMATKSADQYTLSRNSTMIWFYTDDYTDEYGSEQWSGSSGSSPGSPAPADPGEPKPTDEPGSTEKFVDVAKDAWYHDSVYWAVDKGITNGTDETHFSPDAACTRGQMVTFLWRAAGEPAPAAGTENPFADVSADAYYYDAVLWAVEKSITNGTSETAFSPDATVTRAQTVTFLYRYEQSTGGGFTGTWSFQLDYSDVGDVPEWAYEAFCYMTMENVIQGADGKLLPNDDCLRSQIVTMLCRYFSEA